MSSMISIIVPVYNVQEFLAESVKSILKQSYRDFECILVDDGSTDGSSVLCDQIAKRDNRIRVIHKANGGLSDARNAGLDIANGDFVSFIDSDDVIYPNALENMYERIIRDDLDVSIGNVILNDLRTGEQHLFGPLQAFCTEDSVYTIKNDRCLLNAMFNVSLCNKLFRRSLFDERYFIKGIKFEDVPMWTDILFSGARIGCVNKSVYQYNVNREGSIVTTRDYRGYPDVWTYQRKALESHGLFAGKIANDFTARIVMKFIQAYNLSSTVSKREFYLKTQSFFRECGEVGLDSAHNFVVSLVEYIHLLACRNMPCGVYDALFSPERIISHPKINAWLKRRFQ